MSDSDFSYDITVNGHPEMVFSTVNPVKSSIVLECAGYDYWKYVLLPETQAPETAEPISDEDISNAPSRVDLDEYDRFVAVPKQR